MSANVYLGAEAIVEALRQGADLVVTGRVADPSLFLALLRFEFGWAVDDWDRLGAGILVGHLLECAGQVTGGYFADAPFKEMLHLARLGFPIAEIWQDGRAVVTKVSGSGGCVTLDTCKEQLLYEIHDPSAYLTPDCTADFGAVHLEEGGTDRVQVYGGRGHPRPETLKVTLGVLEGYIGEGEISYGGSTALRRATLAAEIVRERLEIVAAKWDELRSDLIGVDSLHGLSRPSASAAPYEIRLCVAGRTRSRAQAEMIGYTNGPAGGGGARKYVHPVLGIRSAYVAREEVKLQVLVEEVQ